MAILERVDELEAMEELSASDDIDAANLPADKRRFNWALQQRLNSRPNNKVVPLVDAKSLD